MGMTTSGIVFISVAWGLIFTLAVYCFSRVFRSERKDNS
jgi:glycerol uptake facilitator-like aquaporin